MSKTKADAQEKPKGTKRFYLSQSEFPRFTLANALIIAEAVWENYAGKGAAPHDIALALDYAPTSGHWRNLCGASIAYGLTDVGYNAPKISLTNLSSRIVAPTKEGDDVTAKVEAILQPRIMREFLQKYDKAKFPKEKIAENVLIGLGVPKERAETSVEILRENGIYTGVLKETKNGLFVALGSPTPLPTFKEKEEKEDKSTLSIQEEEFAKKVAAEPTISKEPKIE